MTKPHSLKHHNLGFYEKINKFENYNEKKKRERWRGDSINRYEIVKVLIFKRNNRIKKKPEDLN